MDPRAAELMPIHVARLALTRSVTQKAVDPSMGPALRIRLTALFPPPTVPRVIRGRLPAIGRPNAEILHHGPPPAYARGQAAVGGAEPWPQVHPGILRGVRAAAGL